MSMFADLRRLRPPCALFALLLAAGCGKDIGAPSAKPGVHEANARTIAQATQAFYGRLGIGVSNVYKDEFTDENGTKKRGLIAILVLSRGGASVPEAIKVHEDQRVGGDTPFVVERIEGGYKGAVRLRFDNPPSAP